MPSVFDNQFATSGFPALLAQFGEPVVYYPATGGQRSIDAIVTRDPPEIYDDQGKAVLPKFTLRVHNSCTLGISSQELDTGGDDISILLKVGDVKPTRRTIMKLMSQDSGVVSIAVR